MINTDFLRSGFLWDSTEIQNLKFNFLDSTPLYWFLSSEFDNKFVLSDFGSAFIEGQEDVVRFLLLPLDDVKTYSGDNVINATLQNSVDYRVSFGDVIQADFSENVNALVQFVNHEGELNDSPSLSGFPEGGLNSGDVIINNIDIGYDDLEASEEGYWLLLHEMGHAVGGLNDFAGTSEEGTYVDFQKYSIMSYNSVNGVFASGLQLLDIKALQDTYGTVNTDTRNEETDGDPLTTGTIYALGQGLGVAGAAANDPFLYTIWDGGGIDTIDASGFSTLAHGAEIDLREGRFSSIGSKTTNGDSWNKDDNPQTLDPDPGNVAIAYGTVIENAIGTNNDDHLIGNAEANRLEGLDGADTFTGGAGDDIFIGGAGIDTLEFDTSFVTLESQTGVTLNLTSSSAGTITDEYGDTDTFSGIENFILTVGKDTVYAGLDSTNNIIKGNLGHDIYTNTGGILEVKDGELWVWDGFGHTHDVLDSFEEITVDKAIASSVATPTFTALLATGSSFTDVDYHDIVGALTFNVSNGALQVTGGGITHNYLNGDTVNVVGNNGDNTYNVTGITKSIITGTGNDTVIVNDIASNVDIHYSGGDDIYQVQQGALNGISIGGSIVGSDISVQSSMLHGTGLGYQVILNIGTNGTITFDHVAPDVNPTAFEATVLTFNNGDTYTVQLGVGEVVTTLTENGGTAGVGGYGTWDKDVLTTNAAGGIFRAFDGKDEITGGVGDDTIYGGAGLDTLKGEAGNDTLYGGDEKDDIDGGAGTNTLYGNLGADTFRLGDGVDTATGGEGADTYIIKSLASGSLTVTDFDINEDRIDLKGLSDPLDFSSINWTVYGNNVEFNVAGAQYSVTLTNVEQSSLTASNFVFGAGAAYTYNLPLVPSIVETGSAIGEVMDFSSAFEGRSIEGLGGDDTLIGTWTSDHLYGGDGNDILNGDYGNDALYGGDGNNTLNGSGGDDYYVINTDTDIGVNTIEEFEGTDTLVFEGSLTTSDIDIYQGGLDLILEGVNNTQSQYWVVQITNTFFTGLGYDSKVEYVVVQDVVYDLDDVFNTGVWTPYVADTSIAPNAFDDLITIDRGGVVTGSVFNDNGSGSDYDSDGTYLEVDAFSATGAYGTFDLLVDGSFTFTGTQNYVGTHAISYTLRDGDGLENQATITLNSIVTNEAPTASAMEANLVLQAGGTLDFVSNFTDPDGDTITYSATLQDGNALPSYIVVDPATGALTGTLPATSQATIGVRVIAADWMSQTIYDFDLSVNNVIAGTTALDYLHGDAGVDIITGDDGNDRLYGYEGDDILDGQAGSDYIYGHEGNDTLTGDAGADSIYGLEGNDTIYGGADNDILRGDDTNSVSGFVDAGNDVVYGDAGNDNISGGDGDDELHGGTGNDVIDGDDGADILYGDDGADFLYGGVGADFIDGGDGNDKLYGEAGTDVLIGGSGTDTLYGGDDNDILIGGTGTDFLYGQGGADIFTLDLTSIDRLSDFDASEGDTINIADLLIGYDSATDDINDFVTLVYRNTGRTDIRVNDDGIGNDLPYVGIVFSDLTGETVNTLVASGTLIVE